MPTLPELTGLILLIFFAILILYFTSRAKENRVPALRPIAAFEALKTMMAQAIETGRRVHFSLGTGGITDRTSAETLAGLSVLESFADQAAASQSPPIITTTDPATMLLAQNVMRKAHGTDYEGTIRAAAQVRWISTNSAAYSAGVMGILSRDDVDGNVMLGHFGDEYLLMGETAHRQNHPVPTVAGTGNPDVLPYVMATSPKGLWGEELFAGGAYLAQRPSHIGSLLAQDTIRWIVSLVILGSVLLKAFGLLG